MEDDEADGSGDGGRNMAAWVAFVYDRPVDIINIIEAGNYECVP